MLSKFKNFQFILNFTKLHALIYKQQDDLLNLLFYFLCQTSTLPK